MKIYQVGGAVRDKLMGLKAHDIDYVVVGATTEEMLKKGFKQVGKGFPVFINPQNQCEYALARKELKTGPKHTDFTFIFSPEMTLSEDLERRDFTCNALAFDEETETVIDEHNGIDDIKRKILRHVNTEHFVEDPLRVLRLCRFAAQLDFEIAPETLDLARQMVSSDMLNHLTPERIWQELAKALQTAHFDKFITSARACGALKIILPEIDRLFDTPERLDFHPEGNSGAHTLLCLKQAAKETPLVKFAVLMHDVGKALTPKNILPSHHKHELNGLEVIRSLCQRLKVPNRFRDFALTTCANHMKMHIICQMRAGKIVDFVDALTGNHQNDIDNFIAVCRADYFGRGKEIRANEQAEFENAAAYLRKAAHILMPLKASDMPNFENIPKDNLFKEKFKNFKIQKLISELDL